MCDRDLSSFKYTCGHIIERKPLLRPCKDNCGKWKDNNLGSRSVKVPCDACLA
ncbi:hypothetical protein M430DRAFT_34916 [Amorphotheca resinae ATCC 22711]|uniref:Uncharacterized protein n=1 Tax=Amorphotheca resinae ATCC 22711 TaxID=857342 RepID=A0A2T3B182_AMORE|nr:hypothetical protein M430DRAFT_34916 [Amorphotheca resinae ATCC 22711]PSS18316.1 hypothetical protein M430DRAFT_34916 [Amorphotheca resinae ATCC 22711]